MKLTYCFLLLAVVFWGCNHVDKSNPEAVVKGYLKFWINNDSKNGYELLSTKSKEIATYDEFKKSWENSPKDREAKINKIEPLEKDLNFPTYRRFRISITDVVNGDSTTSTVYYTLINENNKWKRVWNATLLTVAYEKFDKADYDGAISLYNKAIELNPFDGNAYEKLAWCYMRSGKMYDASTLDKITGYLKYAIALEPDIASHYNAMSQYYGLNNNPDLAIDYLKKGLDLVSNKKEKEVYLANIGIDYTTLGNYDSAKNYLNEALSIDPKFSFALYILGSVYASQGNDAEAIQYYEKVNPDDLENALKADYYGAFAFSLKNTNNYPKSKEMILKALELDPSNIKYKLLYEQVK